MIVHDCRCGIGLDALLSQTVPDKVFLQGVKQPLLFINSFSFLTAETIQLMKKLEKDSDEATNVSPCQILTIKSVSSLPLVFYHSFLPPGPYIILFFTGGLLAKV